MDASPKPVAALLYPEFELLDVCGPLDVFATANRLGRGRPGYELRTLADAPGPVVSSAGIELVAGASWSEAGAPIDTLIVPGAVDPTTALKGELREWILRTASSARRVASVCTGARILAATGLLDGRRATTHWESCGVLAREHPTVQVTPDALFVRDGKFWTSAGISAGIDLALALVEEDLGRPFALEVARELVVYFKRPGGQSQYSAQLFAQSAVGPTLASLVDWIADHLDADLSIEELARRASLSPRHFSRLFREELGTTPARYVEAMRVDAARRLFDDGAEALDEVALRSGFGSVERLRRAFERRLGMPPSRYRANGAGRGAPRPSAVTPPDPPGGSR